MSLYRRRSDGVLMVPVRVEHRMDLRALTLALYHSNEELGAELSARAVRTAVADVLKGHGSDVVLTVSDYLSQEEEYDSDSLVGSDIADRLVWARRMIVKAYGQDFKKYPETLAALRAFEALAPKDIV